jgi:hypothetical protein
VGPEIDETSQSLGLFFFVEIPEMEETLQSLGLGNFFVCKSKLDDWLFFALRFFVIAG